MLTQNQLKDIFFKNNFRPLKQLGENYLIDSNIKDKIISEARIRKGDTILEIGPGFGALTFDLASGGAAVYAVEKDKKAFAILKELTGEDFPNLKIFHQDILEFDIKKNVDSKKIKVVGNLPYYITTPILEHLIANRRVISSVLMTIQKEAAKRLMAVQGEEDYGSISCFIRYYTEPEYIYTIKRTSFYPVPDVDSSLVRLKFRTKPAVDPGDEDMFFKIVRGSFQQRRKSLINSLSRPEVLDRDKADVHKALTDAGIDPSARPETLGLEDFAKISRIFSQ